MDAATENLVAEITRTGDLERLWTPETIGAIAALPPDERLRAFHAIRAAFGESCAPATLQQAIAAQAKPLREFRPGQAAPLPRFLRYATPAERAEWLEAHGLDAAQPGRLRAGDHVEASPLLTPKHLPR